jgi:hypothetical protein
MNKFYKFNEEIFSIFNIDKDIIIHNEIKYKYDFSCNNDKIIEYAKNENADWVLFLDSDMVPPPDTLIKLSAMNVPIASGMAFKRTPPFQPCFYTKVAINKDTLMPDLESPIDFPEKGIPPETS